MKNKGLLRDFPTDNGHILGTILKDMPPKLVPMVHTHLHAYKHNIMQEYYKGLFPADECTLCKEAQTALCTSHNHSIHILYFRYNSTTKKYSSECEILCNKKNVNYLILMTMPWFFK